MQTLSNNIRVVKEGLKHHCANGATLMRGTTDIVKRARAATLVEREEFLFIKSSGAVAGCPTAQSAEAASVVYDTGSIRRRRGAAAAQ